MMVRSLGGSLTSDLSFLLARANALSISVGNTALEPFGLRVRAYSVLALAVEGSRPSQREIAEFLRLDPSQVVALVDGLESAGLVAREPDARDRRANVVVATPSGRRLHGSAQASVLTAERSAHGGLTEAELTSLAELLRKAAFPS